jgi:hypothetical protein
LLVAGVAALGQRVLAGLLIALLQVVAVAVRVPDQSINSPYLILGQQAAAWS